MRKEDYTDPWLRLMVRAGRYGVYFTFKSMEQGPHVSLQGAEVSDPRPPLPYPGAPQGLGVPL